ncbi:MAG: YbgC/FadM family acyl-CoA thioesterase [Arenicellales bacterium]|jgi:acyl-CoA thioester hydrolase
MFSIPVRVYYEDTDAAGIVYHANYLKYMERCRSDWLERCACDVAMVRERFGILFSVRRAILDYLSPARLADSLLVTLSVVKLGRVTLDLEQAVHRGDEILCTGTLRLASVEPQSLKLKPMSDSLLELIQPSSP